MDSQANWFSTPAMWYGIVNEKLTIEQYTQHQQANGQPELLVIKSRFTINPSFPFLGASPDGAVYNSSNQDQPFGFVGAIFCKRQTPTGSCC